MIHSSALVEGAGMGRSETPGWNSIFFNWEIFLWLQPSMIWFRWAFISATTLENGIKDGPYIHSKRNGIHIIDLIQTYSYLKEASHFLTESAAQGKTFLSLAPKTEQLD
jgi:hypothetical protein